MENINNLEARKKTKKVIARTIIFSKKVSWLASTYNYSDGSVLFKKISKA